jgi:predicted GTPase
MMRPIDDAAHIDDDNLIVDLNGVQTVVDGDHRFVLHQVADGLLDAQLVLWIEEGGGFIQQNDGRILRAETV